MYTLKTEHSFDAAHFLYGYEGKCSNIHGHRWRVVAEVSSDQQANDDERDDGEHLDGREPEFRFAVQAHRQDVEDRKSTRLNSSH